MQLEFSYEEWTEIRWALANEIKNQNDIIGTIKYTYMEEKNKMIEEREKRTKKIQKIYNKICKLITKQGQKK